MLAEVITHFAKQHTLYEDKEHHNAVFVGVDENGVPRQASKRSTNIVTAIVSGSLVKVLTQDTALHISVKAKGSMCLRLP